MQQHTQQLTPLHVTTYIHFASVRSEFANSEPESNHQTDN